MVRSGKKKLFCLGISLKKKGTNLFILYMNGLYKFKAIKKNSVVPTSSCCQTNLGTGGHRLVLKTVLITNTHCVDLIDLNWRPSSSVTSCVNLGKLPNLLTSFVFCDISVMISVAKWKLCYIYRYKWNYICKYFSTMPCIEQVPNKC